MLIHSVTPPHMLIEQTSLPPREYKTIPGGYVEVCKTPQGTMTSRLFSTDPSMYLRKELAPGSPYQEPAAITQQ